MLDVTLNKLKEFEVILKKYLIDYFGTYLPEDKIAILNNTSYIDINELKDITNQRELNGRVLRNMLNSILTITCYKEMKINDENSVSLLYGEYLQNGIIEYYAEQISLKYGFDINEIPELRDNLDLVKKLYERLENGLDPKVFNYNALELLNLKGLEDIASVCDEKAMDEYLKKNATLANSEVTTEEENTVLSQYIERQGSVQLVELNNKNYIKYIDQFGKIHLTEVLEDGKAINYYREKIASLKPDEKLDPEAFFHELSDYASEEVLTPTEEVNLNDLNYNQISMLEYIHTSDKFKPETDEQQVLHNQDMTIHVIGESNDIVTTTDHVDHVDGTLIKDELHEVDGVMVQETEDVSEKVLTQEEYEELCLKFANNEELTLEELRALRRSTPELMEEKEHIEYDLNDQEKGPILKNPNYYGFAVKNVVIYLSILFVFIGFILFILIF